MEIVEEIFILTNNKRFIIMKTKKNKTSSIKRKQKIVLFKKIIYSFILKKIVENKRTISLFIFNSINKNIFFSIYFLYYSQYLYIYYLMILQKKV